MENLITTLFVMAIVISFIVLGSKIHNTQEILLDAVRKIQVLYNLTDTLSKNDQILYKQTEEFITQSNKAIHETSETRKCLNSHIKYFGEFTNRFSPDVLNMKRKVSTIQEVLKKLKIIDIENGEEKYDEEKHIG